MVTRGGDVLHSYVDYWPMDKQTYAHAALCWPWYERSTKWRLRELLQYADSVYTVCPPKSEPLNILQQQPQICSDLNKILHTQDICYLLQTLLRSFI